MAKEPELGRQQPDAVWHWALFYEDGAQYVDGVLRYVTDALAADRPVFVAVPDAHGRRLRAHLDSGGRQVRFADMTLLGRNPSCIIPAIRAFIDEHRDQPVSFVGEPIWAGRTQAEIAEATRHEALINAAFAGAGAHVLCPYDVTGLEPAVLADAFRTHPELLTHTGERQASERYDDPRNVWAEVGYLPAPPLEAQRTLASAAELRAVRETARQLAERSGLSEERTHDLLVAVSELAANSIRHGGGSAAITMWVADGRVLCDVQDSGGLDDPLAGRRAPDPDAPDGRGLWLVNHLCDLVQLHSSPAGTTVRITVCAD
jgi:anti-sigma regulatory factor (Ser/Thr protein kinase)